MHHRGRALTYVYDQMLSQNILRKFLEADYYADPVTGDIGNVVKAKIPGHASHCIDLLRQSIQCAADITWASMLLSL